MREVLLHYALPCLWAFLACWGFCVLFNIHGSGIWICCAGGGIYYAMEHAIGGDAGAFAATLMHTLGFSGVLALGVLAVSSAVRMWTLVRRKRGKKA